MRISDWSSDVCSSDLARGRGHRDHRHPHRPHLAPQALTHPRRRGPRLGFSRLATQGTRRLLTPVRSGSTVSTTVVSASSTASSTGVSGPRTGASGSVTGSSTEPAGSGIVVDGDDGASPLRGGVVVVGGGVVVEVVGGGVGVVGGRGARLGCG